jgi:eukaryotic-like serine/threonine-protein kinase
MTCPHCGITATAIDGRCPSCGRAASTDTRTPPRDDADLTRLPGAVDDLTRLPIPPRPTSVTPEIEQQQTVADGVSSPLRSTRNPGGYTPAAGATAQTGLPFQGGSMGGVPLAAGQAFGPRYHVIRLLGSGGMGAVYQAWDDELAVAVAIKVIRPEIVADPVMGEELERRFKRELLLARQVTHRNVVRIHDLGEIDGIKYITMPYIQGSSLAAMLTKHGSLPVGRALALARQIVTGLSAAHEAGVVHRDLKPENIMVDGDQAIIMDFGIARASTPDATRSGAVIGTIGYMAPEQARGGEVDQRADLYAFGLVLYDMLVGRARFAGGQSAMGELFDRMTHVPRPLSEINPDVPAGVNAIVTRCVQPDPAQRYQTSSDLLRDLEQLDSDGHQVQGSTLATAPLATATPASGITQPGPAAVAPVLPKGRKWLRAVAAVLALGVVGGVLVWTGVVPLPTRQTQAQVTTSLVILPFRNLSGDVTLDSVGPGLSGILRTELGQSDRVRTVASDRVHQVLQDLRIAANAAILTPDLARIADLTGARTILSGQITRLGSQIRIDATLQDLDRGDASVPLVALAGNEEGIQNAVSELAAAIREHLARGSADVLAQLKASSWKPSTRSFEALRLYTEGEDLTRQGNHQEALKRFQASTTQDENFALGFSALARSYATLGFDTEASQASRTAMTLSEGAVPQEKYLISATHYQILGDTSKAIDAYTNLAKAWPNTPTVLFRLGELHEGTGDFAKARENFANVVKLDPKFVEGLLALGRVEIRQGEYQDSLKPLNEALTLAIELGNQEVRGNVLQAIGIAYKRLNKPDEALRHFEDSLEIKRTIGAKRGMASSLDEIAGVRATLGGLREAERGYREALALRREIGDKAGIAANLVNLSVLLNESLHRPDEALLLLREALTLRREAGNQNGEALVLNNIGNVYLMKREYAEAQTYFERALTLRQKTNVAGEIADTRHNLAETLAGMGRYDQALTQYHQALDLRRTAKDGRMAAVESYSLGTIFDYQGRYGAAVKAKEEALTTLREAKERGTWLAEILSGLGNSLTLAGRSAEAAKNLDEAMTVARELQSPNLIAQTLTFQSDRAYYTGDAKAALALAQQAAESASKSSDPSRAVVARASMAVASAALQPSRATAAQLRTVGAEADRSGLQYLSVHSLIQSASTLIKIKDYAGAKQAADVALDRSQRLGLRFSLASAHYLRATALRLQGSRDARRDYAAALRLMDELGAEDGNQQLLKRPDVAALYADARRWATTG